MMYLPLVYTSNVKHPNKRFVLRSILQEDGMFWLLATIWVAAAPVWHALATVFFLLSFWCIYEQGYIENDRTALHLEGAQGKVPDGYEDKPSTEIQAWLWAALLAAVGVLVLCWSGAIAAQTPALTKHFSIWLAVLALTRLCFYLYNRLTPSSRLACYPLLQTCRAYAVLGFAAADELGFMLLSAHMMVRTVPYYFYRYSQLPGRQNQWPHMPIFAVRLFFFLLLAVGLAAATRDPGVLFQWQMAAMLAWCVFRARKELRDGYQNLHFLNRT